MNALRSRPRVLVIDAHRYEVRDGPDYGQYVVLRDGLPWAFVRCGDEGNFVGNTVEGWIEPGLVGRIMTEAR
ncbi:MAG TPA: hypothetical protein VK841_07390 [Polyangiaceae bacterium]|nr:hypothetical protein [Polyangiaceae bacterium]